MPEQIYSLVHPDINLGAPRAVVEVWKDWLRLGCHIVDELEDTSYIDGDEPTTVILGGQRSTACVIDHLGVLVQTEAVRSGRVSLVLYLPAIFGMGIIPDVLLLEQKAGIEIGIVDYG